MIGLGVVLFLILANAFFVAGEFALVAVERSSVERRAGEGDKSARRILTSLKNLSFELSGAQLGITITSLVLGFVAEPTIASLIEPLVAGIGVSEGASFAISLSIAFVLATAGQMVFGELVPKNLAIARPWGSAVAFGIPMGVVNRLLRPLILFLNRSANWTVRKLGIEPRDELAGVRSMEELGLLIRSSGDEGSLDEREFELLSRAMTFTEKLATDAMIPRVDVSGLQRSASVRELIDLATSTGHSRFPVYGADRDEVVGVAHVKDSLGVEDPSSATVGDVMEDPFLVPETASLESLLRQLQRKGRGLAVIVDEYGGMAGIVTIEDLLEEILGDIADEHDRGASDAFTEDSEVVSGALHRHELEELTGFVWPEGRYETLGGFLIATLGRFPSVGEVIEFDNHAFKVVEMDRHRVAQVRVRRTVPLETPEDGQ